MNKNHPEYGSDIIVDLLKSFEIEYVAFNPGSSFRGLHDSLVNYGGNQMPEVITCTHEEISVGIAHGYARAKCKPMAAAVHNIVGLQHATMAIYNAWCDRLPIIVLGATGPVDSVQRRPWIEWVHTALVQGNQVRDYVKWDDQPASVEAVPESFIRAYRLATTDPMAPVYLCYDGSLQEEKLDREIPVPSPDRHPAPLPMQAPEEGFEKTMGMLFESRAPVIIADCVGRNEAGFRALGELADLLAIPVFDQYGRFNFPMDHPLNLTGMQEKALPKADFVLSLDVMDQERSLNKVIQEKGQRTSMPLIPSDAKIINVGLNDLLVHSWAADFCTLRETDLSILADTSVFLPELVRRLKDEKGQLTKLKDHIEKRRGDWSKLHVERDAGFAEDLKKTGNDSPISTSRLFTEIAKTVEQEDWVQTNGILGGKENFFLRGKKFNQVLGQFRGGGLGYGLPASLGAALAHRGSDKICIDIQPDGDLLYTAGALWTAAHDNIPLLMVVFNNHTYYNSEQHQERMARQRNRPPENRKIGIRIEGPDVDFAGMARSYGLWGIGPVTKPGELADALGQALRVVKDEGRFALVDVVCQVR